MTGEYEIEVKVWQRLVTVTGHVDNGIVNIGTVYIPWTDDIPGLPDNIKGTDVTKSDATMPNYKADLTRSEFESEL